MRTIFIFAFTIIGYASFGQVSSKVSMHCGTKSKKAREYFDAGNFGLTTNQLDKAKSLYLAAVREDSLFCDAWDNLSICCRRLGHYKDAFASGSHSLVIDSTNAIAWSNCGYAAYLDNDIYRALTSFDNLQRIIPLDPEGYYGKSLVLYSIDSLFVAQTNIEKAERLYKINKKKVGSELYLLKGFIEYKLGNTQLAQNLFIKVYPDFKDNAELNYYLGMCIDKNESDKIKAQKYLDRANKLGYIPENDTTQIK
jgi:tetratricopeptide (TPR) repeat protein